MSRVRIYSLVILFPNFKPIHCFMCHSNCCFLTCIQVSQETGKVYLYSHLFRNFLNCCDPHNQIFNMFSGAEVNVFLELPCFLMIQQMLVIWSLIAMPIWKPSCTFGSSPFITVEASLKVSEHILSNMWNESNYIVVWTLFGISFFSD